MTANTEQLISGRLDHLQDFDGYLAEFNFVDGTALDPTSFGETINGVWVPKAYDTADGAYGTNGFYLSFADSGAIGDDLSGNTNDFTATNLAASDVVPDSPTNNWCTFNPLDISGTTLTYSEGNLKAERTSSSFAQAYSSFSFDSGKWYAEFLLDTGNSGVGVIAGTTNAGANRYLGQDSFTYSYYFDGRKVNNATYTAYGDSYTTAADGSGDVVGVYIDADNGDIYFSKNGTVQNSGTAAFTGVTGPFRFAIASESNCFHIANFGQDDSFAGLKTSGSAAASDDNGNGVFYDTIGLSGYLAPCSSNLPEPVIGPNSTAGQADDYFDTILYTAATSNGTYTHGNLSFQPDFSWLKNRNVTGEKHFLADVVRGNQSITDKWLNSNATNAEGANGVSGVTFSTTSTGYEFVVTNITGGEVYYSGRTYVGWNWKAGGTAVSNTDGSITSQVSAAPDAGFSIVGFTSTGNTETVGHGLSRAPELYIRKSRTNAENWVNFFTVVDGTLDFMNLNTTNAASGSGASLPTSTVFSIGGGETNGETHVCYCFHSVDGFSKVGSYVGNGNADGTFVYTGFRPAWIMTKRTNTTSNWLIIDVKRDIDNVAHHRLIPNSTNAEATSVVATMDILSNGFKRRDTNADVNASGGTYIYLAFAETPAKYSNAR